MTVTLHPAPGQSLGDLVRLLYDISDGPRERVRTGNGGAVVDDALALTYLTGITLAARAAAAGDVPASPQETPPAAAGQQPSPTAKPAARGRRTNSKAKPEGA
jgi:hypothetical protein